MTNRISSKKGLQMVGTWFLVLAFVLTQAQFLLAVSILPAQAEIGPETESCQDGKCPEPVCPFEEQEGRTIVYFSGEYIVSHREEAHATEGPVSTSLVSGDYQISLFSFDEHSDEPTPAYQPAESWYLKLKNSSDEIVATSNPISDLPDDQDTLMEVVNDSLNFDEMVVSATAFHAAYPVNNPNSIHPICAAFDLLEEECGDCDGKVTWLTLSYNGPGTVDVSVEQNDNDIVFDDSVSSGEEFTFYGTFGQHNTLGPEITIYVDNNENTKMHTSCSVPIGPGFTSGDFTVIAGASRNGGPLCPVEQECIPGVVLSCDSGEYGICAEGSMTCDLDGTWGPCIPLEEPAEEICDNLDNDCDDQIDEDLGSTPTECGVGECAATGELICSEGGWEDTCTPGNPNEEICDGLDNDCDTFIDEDLGTTPTECGVGACEATGELACLCGDWEDSCVPGTPVAEICDNDIDDDCDGYTDEDDYDCQDCTPGIEERCGFSDVGECEYGTHVCQPDGFWGACEGFIDPTDEICDDLDNDCDDEVDEGGVCPQCGDGELDDSEQCDDGNLINGDGCSSTCEIEEFCTNPTYETEVLCFDSDYDSSSQLSTYVREIYSPASHWSGGSGSCGVAGNYYIDSDSEQGPYGSLVLYTPSLPIAGQYVFSFNYGIGNDPQTEDFSVECSGVTYEFPDLDDDGTFDWHNKSILCDLEAGVNHITFTSLDSGSVHFDIFNLYTCDYLECIPGTEQSCDSGEYGICAEGSQSCEEDGTWGECIPLEEPGEEICDNLDNDCDDLVDEDLDTTPTECGVGACEATGELACLSGDWEDSCVPGLPVDEICDNDIDDDCDGYTDEDDYDCQDCTPGIEERCGFSDVGECEYGTHVCQPDGFWGACEGFIDPTDEICDYLDNDCDALTDEGWDDLTLECTLGEGQCVATGNYICDIDNPEGPEVCDAVPEEPTEEICDGLDNDCDGDIDEEGVCEDSSVCGYVFFDDDQNGLMDLTDYGLVDWTVNLKQQTACSQGEEWADFVVDYTAGIRSDGQPLVADRTDPSNALGAAQDDDTINFVSLGFGGSLTLGFDQLIVNGAGNDLAITETTYGALDCETYPEKANVYASQSGLEGEWTFVGNGCLDSEFDLGALDWAQYIKIVDGTNPNDFAGVADGYDVDAVEVLNCMSDWQIVATELSATDGQYCFEDLAAGNYRVEEVLQSGWTNTTDLFKDITLLDDQSIEIDFGNYQAPEWPECIPGAIRSCGDTEEGECSYGQETCDELGYWGECIGAQGPSGEFCDGLDNDCDGLIDEDWEDLGQECTSGLGICQEPGVYICNPDNPAGVEICDATPGTPIDEICDNDLDDDCDGYTDEDDSDCQACTPGEQRQCGITDEGACSYGQETCDDLGVWGQCLGLIEPVTEICDNEIDDDCDSYIDYDDPDCIYPECTPGSEESCGASDVGQCEFGSKICNDLGYWGECLGEVGPSAESCDGIDNDCDDSIDEDGACYTPTPVVPASSGPGRGYTPPPTFDIIDEVVNCGLGSGQTTITWTTDLPTTSRIIYGTAPNPNPTSPANYGYAYTAGYDGALVTSHSVTVTGLTDGQSYYFRPVSELKNLEVYGDELTCGQVLGEEFEECLTCEDIEYDLYIVVADADGAERHMFTKYTKIEELGNGIRLVHFEDSGIIDMDHNDIVVRVDRSDCSKLIINPISHNAAWHHEVRLAFMFNGVVIKDALLWPDSHLAADKKEVTSFHLGDYLNMCPLEILAEEITQEGPTPTLVAPVPAVAAPLTPAPVVTSPLAGIVAGEEFEEPEVKDAEQPAVEPTSEPAVEVGEDTTESEGVDESAAAVTGDDQQESESAEESQEAEKVSDGLGGSLWFIIILLVVVIVVAIVYLVRSVRTKE